MKTQIIALQVHDSRVSIRDRMSWAKSARILLVWPATGRVQLRTLDLRILQQHAHELGAELGIVTRRQSVRRDADRFGIPTFATAAEAQRRRWILRSRGIPRDRPRSSASRLRNAVSEYRKLASPVALPPALRVGLFVLAFLAVVALIGVIAPTASITLAPARLAQEETIPVVAGTDVPFAPATGGVPSHLLTVEVSGTRSVAIVAKAQIPDTSCKGVARFENLTQSPVIVPAGTVVFSTSPLSARFSTTVEGRLGTRPKASAEVPIQCLQSGEEGNVPANSIQSIEGPLAASVSVTNPEATTGGASYLAKVASDSDREHARAELLDNLHTQAEAELHQLAGNSDVLLGSSVTMLRIVREQTTPGRGQPGGTLTVDMDVEFSGQYVTSADLKRIADARLGAQVPPGYEPVSDSLVVHLAQEPRALPGGQSAFEIAAARALVHIVDPFQAILLVRGRSPAQANRSLQSAWPLSEPPRIRLNPPWWPWLPQIPIRISVQVV